MRTESINILSGDSVADINGTAKSTDQVVNLSVVVYSSGSGVAGVLKLQVSNDAPNIQPRTLFTPTNWVDLTNGSATITAGASALIKVDNCSFGYLRAIWTHDAGGSTGTITAQMNAVGV